MKAVIVLVVLVGFAAVVASVIVGSFSFDGLVVDKPYERGLQWDREQKEREESGLQVQVRNAVVVSGRCALVVSVTDRDGRPVERTSVMLTVSRPSSVSYDRTYAMSPASDGSYEATVDFHRAGIWDLKFLVIYRGKEILLERRVIAEEAGPSVQGRDYEQHRCDLNAGPCSAVIHGHKVVLDITPRPLQAMQPLAFSLSLDSPLKAEKIVIDLTMPGMYMGSNRVIARKAGTSLYRGEGVIPRCPGGADLWQAAVEIPDTGRAVFEFHVAR
jgi:nitrogen fixation protein FixH